MKIRPESNLQVSITHTSAWLLGNSCLNNVLIILRKTEQIMPLVRICVMKFCYTEITERNSFYGEENRSSPIPISCLLVYNAVALYVRCSPKICVP
jgi:hypothetical protein